MKIAFIDFIFENKELIKLENCQFNIARPFSDQAQLIQFAKNVDILCGRDQFLKWDKKLISALPKLKCIATRSTGHDHIDWQYAAEKEIPVFNVPGYGRNTVAEFAMGLALNVMRQIPNAAQRYKNCDYSIDGIKGFDLKGKVAGILGTGAIGQEMIKICQGFSMQIFAYDVFPNPEIEKQMNFKYVSLDKLLKMSDLISVHVPLNEQTYHLFDKKAFARMKPTAVIVNTGRGEIIDTEALINALQNRQIYGAGLDVIESERKKTYDFTDLNAVVTTHMAWYTEEAIARITEISLANIRAFLNGTFQNCVNRHLILGQE